ncbi:hypothetical protein EJB05_05625 [Eragrostis curvula]|uniref:TF-B3 domain-containing protein n=1 Tax=Eragrostis curvula TaxID=38414 RepID=A0A5J9WDZ9_9POAL|nr:hypothetical protein EJB05_05625 [Eragrostis curvula]
MKRAALGQLNIVCEVCGDIGFKHLLVLCTDCRCSAAHRYCLDKVVFDASLTDWLCYECLQERGEITGSRSLEKMWERTRDGHDEVFSCAAIETSGHFIDTASSCQYGTTESSETSKRFAKRQKGSSCRHGKTVVMATTSSSSEESGDDTPSENESLESDDPQAPLVADFVLPRRSYLSEGQKDRVIAHIQEIKPDITVFVAIMHRTHVQPPSASLGISAEYASAHFPSKSTNVTLERPGKSKKWHPSYYKHNELSAGVHVPPESDAHGVSTGSMEDSGDDTPFENGSLESDDFQAPPVADCVLSLGSYVSEAQKDRVIAHIQEIKPDVTVFVAIMHKTNVQPPCASLAISAKYASAHFPHESTIVKLERPGKRKKWHPSYYKHKGACVLGGQWFDFVKDNHVQKGDICLLFPTKGGRKLSFTVHLLHATAADSRGGTSFQSVTSCCGVNVPPENGAHGISTGSMEDSGDDTPSENGSLESDDFQAPRMADYVLPLRSYLSEAQKDRVIAHIQEIKPGITVFVAIMQRTHVQPPCASLAISAKYASTHFPHESTNVTLERPGTSKKWHPSYYKHKGLCVLRGKWIDFVKDNHVQEGDICLLFPTKDGRKLSFTVHLLHATAADSRGGTGFQSVSSCCEPSAGVHVPPESDAHGISTRSTEDCGDPSKPPYILSCKNHLSEPEKKIVEHKVRAIQSEVPIYVAVMSKRDVIGSCELEFGRRYAVANLPGTRRSVEINCTGRTWKAQMVVRSGRWFLCGGWSTFVRDNILRVGDICLIIPKMNGRELSMMVRIIYREDL